MTQLVVPQFIVPPHPPAPPAVAGGTPQPAPQPEFAGTAGKATDTDPTTTGAEPGIVAVISNGNVGRVMMRDLKGREAKQREKAIFFYKA